MIFIQLILILFGLIQTELIQREFSPLPGIGIAADLVNGGIHVARGNYVDAGMSFVGAIPGIGDATVATYKAAGLAAATVVVTTKLDDVADLVKAGNTVAKNADNAVDVGKQAAKNADNTGKYSRPSGFRKGVREEVYENAKEPSTGVARDPLTGQFIGKDSDWDMGHKPGIEFKKHQTSAAERNISREQFLDEHNNPSHYRPELPSSNRSHRGEAPDDIDLW